MPEVNGGEVETDKRCPAVPAIGAVRVIRDQVQGWKGITGVGKGLPKIEIDFGT